MLGLSVTTYVSDGRHCWETEHILFSYREMCVPRKGESLCTGAKMYHCVILLDKSEIVKCPRGIKGPPLNEEVWKRGLYNLGAEGSLHLQIFAELSWR